MTMTHVINTTTHQLLKTWLLHVYNKLKLRSLRTISVVISALLLNTGVNLKRTCTVLNLLCIRD